MTFFGLTANIFRSDTSATNHYDANGTIVGLETWVQVRSFGAHSLNNEVEYLDAGVPFIRGVNMKGGRVSFSDMFYIRSEAHKLLWKSEVKEGMVLLSMSGTIGDVAIATARWPYPVNSNGSATFIL